MQPQPASLSHRPMLEMPLFDEQQAKELARVKLNIAPLVLAWFEGQQPGDEFYINELTRFVWRTAPNVAADSPRRVMAALKDEGKLNYEASRKGLYRVLAVEADEDDSEDVIILRRTSDGSVIYYPDAEAELTAILESEVA